MNDDITVKGLICEVVVVAMSIGLLNVSFRYMVYKLFEIVLQLSD